jgi:anti-anti-sigma factor
MPETVAYPVRQPILVLDQFWATPFTVVVTAQVDIDASNADDVRAYVDAATAACAQVVLDLSGVEFFGIAGLSALEDIVRAEPSASRMAVVPSRAVVRLVEACHAPSMIPVVDDVAAALVAVQVGRPALERTA